MKLKVNDKSLELPFGSSLSYLIKDLSLSSSTGIAVAVNEEVIAKTDWEKYVLKEDDSILIIQASQGG